MKKELFIKDKKNISFAVSAGLIMCAYTARCYITQCREVSRIPLLLGTFLVILVIGVFMAFYVSKHNYETESYLLVALAVFSNAVCGNFGLDASKYAMLMFVPSYLLCFYGLSRFKGGWISLIGYVLLCILSRLYGFQPILIPAIIIAFYCAFCRKPPKNMRDKNISKSWKQTNETNQFWLIAIGLMFVVTLVISALRGHIFQSGSFNYDVSFVVEEICLSLPFLVPMFAVLIMYIKKTEMRSRKAFGVLVMLLPVFVFALCSFQNLTGFLGKGKYAVNIGILSAFYIMYENKDDDFECVYNGIKDYFYNNKSLFIIIAVCILFGGIAAARTSV